MDQIAKFRISRKRLQYRKRIARLSTRLSWIRPAPYRSTQSNLQNGNLKSHFEQTNIQAFQDSPRSKTRSKFQPSTLQPSTRTPHPQDEGRRSRNTDRVEKARLTLLCRRPDAHSRELKNDATTIPHDGKMATRM